LSASRVHRPNCTLLLLNEYSLFNQRQIITCCRVFHAAPFRTRRMSNPNYLLWHFNGVRRNTATPRAPNPCKIAISNPLQGQIQLPRAFASLLRVSAGQIWISQPNIRPSGQEQGGHILIGPFTVSLRNGVNGSRQKHQKYLAQRERFLSSKIVNVCYFF
jgi:hypothetical protein